MKPATEIEHERHELARSLWSATANGTQPFLPLAGSEDADVAIIGAGFTGLSAALHLAEKGVRATVLEARTPGWGASGRNGGQVLPGLKEDPDTIERMFGPDLGPRLVALAGGAPDELFRLVERYSIECDPVRAGWIQPAHSAETLAASVERVRQWQKRGAPIESLSREAISEMIGTRAYLGGAIDRRAGSVHPLNLSLGMAGAASGLGVRIYGDSPVTNVAGDAGRGFTVSTARGSVRAGKVLVCTNGYTPATFSPLRQSVIPVCSIQVASQPLDPATRARALRDGQVVSDMYRLLSYYRFDAHGRFLMGGRGAYRTASILSQLERARIRARELFGDSLGDLRWEYAWGGNVAVTKDHFPHLNRLADGMFAALGYNGRGVAMSVVLGRLLSELATGRAERELDFPLTPVAPIPMHAFHPLAVGSIVAWNGWLDRRERRSAPLRN